jgi:hypothetical protein
LEQLSYLDALKQRLRALAAAGYSTGQIAARLNGEGYRPPKRRETFQAKGVQELLRRFGIRRPQARFRAKPPTTVLGEHEWWLAELAQTLGMPPVTLYNWIKRGWARARQDTPAPHRWIVWADDAEVARLRQHAQRPAGYYTRRLWVGDEPLVPQAEP